MRLDDLCGRRCPGDRNRPQRPSSSRWTPGDSTSSRCLVCLRIVGARGLEQRDDGGSTHHLDLERSEFGFRSVPGDARLGPRGLQPDRRNDGGASYQTQDKCRTKIDALRAPIWRPFLLATVRAGGLYAAVPNRCFRKVLVLWTSLIV